MEKENCKIYDKLSSLVSIIIIQELVIIFSRRCLQEESYAEPADDFFEEVDDYWEPGCDAASIYDQLALRRFREILREQIK